MGKRAAQRPGMRTRLVNRSGFTHPVSASDGDARADTRRGHAHVGESVEGGAVVGEAGRARQMVGRRGEMLDADVLRLDKLPPYSSYAVLLSLSQLCVGASAEGSPESEVQPSKPGFFEGFPCLAQLEPFRP
jgi:hypothetical protein